MHVLDKAGDAGGAIGGETAEAEDVREREAAGFVDMGGSFELGA